jgi:predicted RNase H-like HicB family nuclease
MRYLAVFEVGSKNLSGFLPDVPGVVSTASSLEEMRQTMREAVEFHLEALATDGDNIPGPRTTTVDFAQEDPEQVLSCVVEWLEIEVPRMQSVA